MAVDVLDLSWADRKERVEHDDSTDNSNKMMELNNSTQDRYLFKSSKT